MTVTARFCAGEIYFPQLGPLMANTDRLVVSIRCKLLALKGVVFFLPQSCITKDGV